jgi:hypothetical protein
MEGKNVRIEMDENCPNWAGWKLSELIWIKSSKCVKK